MRTPGLADPACGFANRNLNTLGPLPAAPATSEAFRGNGQNVVSLDGEHDTVVVVHWIKKEAALNSFIARVPGAQPTRRP